VTYLDAHNHLHDARLSAHRPEIWSELDRIGLGLAVVNGTREADWDAVSSLALEHPFVVPSYGLHPWYVRERSANWLGGLRAHLEAAPAAAVGEIGLDRWIEGHDLTVQTPVFEAQLDLATELNRAVTIHCMQAWGALQEVLAKKAVPRGFLLHAYGGSAELVAWFAERGAYFSFSPYFLHPRKSAQRGVFRQIPLDRLLVETDAPDLRPPDERNPRPITGPDGDALNHPANIDLSYAALAELRGMSVSELSEIVAANFARLFGRAVDGSSSN
jgi:TatD DNase family protein